MNFTRLYSFLSLIICLGIAPTAFALTTSTVTPPPNFAIHQSQVTFVDFKSANYKITANHSTHRVEAESTILLEQGSNGRIAFDLVNDPSLIQLDGQLVQSEVISTPGQETQLRILSVDSAPGMHELKITNQITEGAQFPWLKKDLIIFFKMLDLTDRKFLEQYLPTNLEYDQYKMTIDLTLEMKHPESQVVEANGKVSRLALNHWKIEFPEYFTASSLFFHTFPDRKFNRVFFNYRSIDGRSIPVSLYTQKILRVNRFAEKATQYLNELEADYGPFPHDSVIVYGKGLSGGMEYSGATETSLSSLDHELLHSYFAKGIMPANGSAGFIDEAIASWRDYGYQTLDNPGFTESNVGGHSPYQRNTDKRCYVLGRGFMAYLDAQMRAHGFANGLKEFLRYLIKTRMHQLITVDIFKEEYLHFTHIDAADDFDRYVLGKYGPGPQSKLSADFFHFIKE